MALHGQLLNLVSMPIAGLGHHGRRVGQHGKPKQLQHLQRQTFAGRDSAASASQVPTAS